MAQQQRIHLPKQEMQEAQVRSLGQEDPLEKERAAHSSIHAWRIQWTEEPGGYSPWSHKELYTTEGLTLSLHLHLLTSTGFLARVVFLRLFRRISGCLWLQGTPLS